MQHRGIACHVPFVMTMHQTHCNIEGKSRYEQALHVKPAAAQHRTTQHSTAAAQHSSWHKKMRHSIQPMTAGDSMHSRRPVGSSRPGAHVHVGHGLNGGVVVIVEGDG